MKEKHKSMDTGNQGNYIPAQEVSLTRDNVSSLHKIIVKNWVTHSSPKKDIFNIVICNISLDSSTHHWDLPKLNQLMGFTNPNCQGKSYSNFSSIFISKALTYLFTTECYAVILTTNVIEMGELMTLLAIPPGSCCTSSLPVCPMSTPKLLVESNTMV